VVKKIFSQVKVLENFVFGIFPNGSIFRLDFSVDSAQPIVYKKEESIFSKFGELICYTPVNCDIFLVGTKLGYLLLVKCLNNGVLDVFQVMREHDLPILNVALFKNKVITSDESNQLKLWQFFSNKIPVDLSLLCRNNI